MPIDQLANYAEVFGAVAVIVSLLYVAAQIRANTREQRHRARYDQFEIQTSVYDLMIADVDTTRIILKGNVDYDSLTDEERVRYGAAKLKALHAFYLIMEMRDDGLVDDAVFKGFEQFLFGSLSSPGSRYWWNEMQFPRYVAPRVRDHFNRLYEAEDRSRGGGSEGSDDA